MAQLLPSRAADQGISVRRRNVVAVANSNGQQIGGEGNEYQSTETLPPGWARETPALLRSYWSISERQVATSVVLRFDH
jgi:hypothetical protein